MVPMDERKDNADAKPEDKVNTKLLLGVLVVIVLVCGYMFFFTGVFQQQSEEVKTASAGPQQIKLPMPPRPGSVEAVVKAPPTAPAPAPVVAVAPAKKVEEKPKQAGSLVPPQVSVKTEKPATQVKKAKKAEKAPVTEAVSEKPEKEVVEKPSAASYVLETGDILSAKKAERLVAKMKGEGLKNVKRQTQNREHSMTRLLYGEYNDKKTLRKEMDKLKSMSDGVFSLESNGKYMLFAGSYDKEERAEIQVKRLAAKGVKITPVKAMVNIPVNRVSALLKDDKAAEKWVSRLKELGVDATAQPSGK